MKKHTRKNYNTGARRLLTEDLAQERKRLKDAKDEAARLRAMLADIYYAAATKRQ